ncbi:hypothetical protein [Nonomuraea sp. NPDC049400]|uniref:hypothetical protein n=1 Tax=Nonomuraea sp. NPDC049400 TaxID=3364352 RepID=UPI0037AB8CF6
MSSTNACNGPCNNTARRLIADYERALDGYVELLDEWIAGGQQGEEPAEPMAPELTVYEGEPLFCRRCRALVRAALLDLDQLATELSARSDGHRGSVPEGRVSGSRTSGSPSPTADLLDALYGDLTDVEDEWRQRWGFAPRTHRAHRGADPRSRCIGWLSERLDGILAAEEHIGFAARVLRWEVVLRERLQEDSVGTKSPIRCPRCSERRVVREREGYWQCGACTMMLSDPVERQQRHDQGVELEVAGVS